MNRNERIEPPDVAPPAGLYSHAWRVPAGSELLYLAGQVAIDPAGNVVGPGDIAAQLEQVFRNLGAVLGGAGFEFADVVKVTTYLVHDVDLKAYRSARNGVYERHLPDGRYPASTLLVIDRLASPDYLVEVEAVAARTL